MLQYSRNLKTISNLSVIKKIVYNVSNGFSSNSKKDGDAESENLEKNEVTKLLDEAATFSEMNNTEWATTPYPATAAQSTKDIETKPKIDPSETSIILFPGQGIIKVGDAKQYMDYPRARELFQIANEILGFDLMKMCLKGPQNLLNMTEFNQPATVVTSLAALEKLQEERPRAIDSCIATAGYSVGELTALIFSGALTFEDGIKLVGVRAAAMQAASEMTSQGMLSSYCTPQAKAFKICQEAEKWALDIGATQPVCRIAIYVHTQGKIFAGCTEALDYIEKNGRNLGLRKVQRLPVSGAFHTPLMEPALKSFRRGLEHVQIDEPNATVYSNYSIKPYTANDKLNKKYLTQQIISPVKWEQIIHKLYERPAGSKFPRTFDMGSRGAMKTILKMINAKAADSCYVY